MKSIYETLAALGTGAVLLGGCGASGQNTNPDVPAVVDTTPVEAKGADATQEATDDAAAADAADATTPPPADNAAASPAPDASAAASAAPAAPPKPKAKPKPVAKPKPKPDAGGEGCGEGTCGKP